MSKRNRHSGRRTGVSNVLPTVGRTEDGKLVVAGVYEFHETYGMPLEWLFSFFVEKNIVPDWIDFYDWAKKNGMKHNRIINKIKDPITDAWGFNYCNIVCTTLERIKYEY